MPEAIKNGKFAHSDKNPGDPILSADWNASMREVVRLETDKVNRQGADTIQGPLTIEAALTINSPVGIGKPNPSAQLEVTGKGGSNIDLVVNGRLQSNNNDGGLWVSSDRFVGGHSTNEIGIWNGNAFRLTVQNNGNVGIGTATSAGKLQIINTGQTAGGDTLILGPTNSSNLRLGYHSDYSWIQSHGSKPLLINPLGNNVGISTTAVPTEKLEVNGNIKAINATLTGTLTVSTISTLTGNVGIGRSPTQALHVAVDKSVRFDLGTSQKLSLGGNGSFEIDAPNITGGRFIVTNAGSVGIGTTSPDSKLHIDKGRVDITASDATGGGQNRFDGLRSHTEGTYKRSQLVVSSGYSDLVIASCQANNLHGSTLTFVTSNPTNTAQYRKWVINQGNWGNRKQFLEFGYSDTDGITNPHDCINNTATVLTIDGVNKRVGIGSNTPEAALHIQQSANNSGIRLYEFGSSRYFRIAYEGQGNIHFYHQNTLGHWMDQNGNWNKNSDICLKEDIVNLENTLEKAMEMRPVHFKWRNSDGRDIGFIAQDIEAIFPELISSSMREGQSIKGLSYDSFGVIAIAAIQEMKKYYDSKIDLLEHKLAELSQV